MRTPCRIASTAARNLWAANLKRLRAERGYTQAQPGARANLRRSYVSNVEHGKVNITFANLDALAIALDYPLYLLLTPPPAPAAPAQSLEHDATECVTGLPPSADAMGCALLGALDEGPATDTRRKSLKCVLHSTPCSFVRLPHRKTVKQQCELVYALPIERL